MTNLVKGYQTRSRNGQYETLYCVFADGRVYRTQPVPRPNSSFLGRGRTWHAHDDVPGDAEYIGEYPAPLIAYLRH